MGFTINSVIAASEKLKREEVRFLEAVKQGSSSVTKRSTKKIQKRKYEEEDTLRWEARKTP